MTKLSGMFRSLVCVGGSHADIFSKHRNRTRGSCKERLSSTVASHMRMGIWGRDGESDKN